MLGHLEQSAQFEKQLNTLAEELEITGKQLLKASEEKDEVLYSEMLEKYSTTCEELSKLLFQMAKAGQDFAERLPLLELKRGALN